MLAGRKQSVGTHEMFALVGTLPRSLDGNQLVLLASFDGSEPFGQVTNRSGAGEMWGFNDGPVYTAGTWTFEMTDLEGNVLASGEVEVTE